MYVGVLTVLLGEQPLDDIGVKAVEFGCGGFVGNGHLSRTECLDGDNAERARTKLRDHPRRPLLGRVGVSNND